MGMRKTSLGEALFTKTQRRVLGLLFGNPGRSYYANEIVRYAGAGIGAVQRELAHLESARLVTVSRLGNQKHYQANREAPIFLSLWPPCTDHRCDRAALPGISEGRYCRR